jgi:hypothetical protein
VFSGVATNVSLSGASWIGTCCRSCVVSNDPAFRFWIHPLIRCSQSCICTCDHVVHWLCSGGSDTLLLPKASRLPTSPHSGNPRYWVSCVWIFFHPLPSPQPAYPHSHQSIEPSFGESIQLAQHDLLSLVPRFPVPTKLGSPEMAGREMDEVCRQPLLNRSKLIVDKHQHLRLVNRFVVSRRLQEF